MTTLNLAFFGTPQFSVSSLMNLNELSFVNIVSVISMPDRPVGRGKKVQSPAVISYAKENNLPYFQTENINREEEFIEHLERQNIDLFIVIAFSQFLGKRILKLPRLGAFNIHTSLLPQYRGAAPIQYALLNGDTQTGVSIQKMVRKMDAGDIVYEHSVQIDPNETCDLLFKKLEKESACALINFLAQLSNDGNSLSPRKQNEKEATFAPQISKHDGFINPLSEDAPTLYNKFRAFFPWPGLFLYYAPKKRLKIIQLSLSKNIVPPGVFDYSSGELILGTLKGSIHLQKIQLEGKKAISDGDFINTLKSTQQKLKLDTSYYD